VADGDEVELTTVDEEDNVVELELKLELKLELGLI